MTQIEALQAIAALVSKGWTFRLEVSQEGWTCKALGAGLAIADCSGASLEEAVTLAIAEASMMEDDPAVMIRKHEPWIRRNIEEVFGMGSFKGIEADQDLYADFSPKHLVISVLANCEPSVFVDRELEFGKRLDGQPEEVKNIWRIEALWPEEASSK